MSKGFRITRDRSFQWFWNATKGDWVTLMDGSYTVYRREANARKAAGALTVYWPQAGYEADIHQKELSQSAEPRRD